MAKTVYDWSYKNLRTGDHLFRLYRFDVGKWRLQAGHVEVLENYILRFLLANKAHTVSLLGLASSTGSEKFNLRLSLQRAMTVRGFLLGRGAQVSQLEDSLYGSLARGEGPARVAAGGQDNIEDAMWRAVEIRCNQHRRDQMWQQFEEQTRQRRDRAFETGSMESLGPMPTPHMPPPFPIFGE